MRILSIKQESKICSSIFGHHASKVHALQSMQATTSLITSHCIAFLDKPGDLSGLEGPQCRRQYLTAEQVPRIRFLDWHGPSAPPYECKWSSVPIPKLILADRAAVSKTRGTLSCLFIN